MGPWHELVIEGPESAARTFVAGLLAGRGVRGKVVFGADVGVAPESLGERVRELFARGRHHVCLAADEVVEALAGALAQDGAELGLRLERRRVVTAGRFTIRVEACSREAAATIRDALFAAPPPGVSLAGLSQTEERRPEGHGVEMYAPVHEYVYRVSGEIVGALPGILEVRRRAQSLTFTTVGPLYLEGTPAAG